MIQDASSRLKFRSSQIEQHPATIPVFPSKNAGSCFDPIQETQDEQMPL